MIFHSIDLLRSVYGCAKIVFLTGHLSEQIEKVIPSLITKDLEVEFVRDQTAGGTLATVMNHSTGADRFAYSHGNICLGSKAQRLLRDALDTVSPQMSILASSTYNIAPTHPHLAVRGSFVREIGDQSPMFGRCSVGTGYYSMEAFADHGSARGDRLEEGLDPSFLIANHVRHVDVGLDWYHLEDLSFYD